MEGGKKICLDQFCQESPFERGWALVSSKRMIVFNIKGHFVALFTSLCIQRIERNYVLELNKFFGEVGVCIQYGLRVIAFVACSILSC